MRLKPILLLLLTFQFLFSCTIRNKSTPTLNEKLPSSFYPNEKIKVLVVGTIHFDYPNLDAFKVAEKDKIDILKEPKKSEVSELVEYIKKFRPTKVAIEASESWNASKKLKEYKKGKFRNCRDERFQIGLRITSELGLDTIYSIDAKGLNQELNKKDSIYFEDLFKDYDFKSNDPFDKMTEAWLNYEKQIISKTHLLDYFKRINSEEYHRHDLGAYLIGDFKLEKYRGADILSIWWYSRNLRIFRNLQKITSNTNDIVLVIVGNGHAAILRQLIESSPEYEFLEFNNQQHP